MKSLLFGLLVLNSALSQADTYIRHQINCTVTGSVESLSSPQKELPIKLRFKADVSELANEDNFYRHKVVKSSFSHMSSVEVLSKKECRKRKKNHEGECLEKNQKGERLFITDLGFNPFIITKMYQTKDYIHGGIGSKRRYINTFGFKIEEMNISEAGSLLKLLGAKDVEQLPHGFTNLERVDASGPRTYRIREELDVNDGRSLQISLNCGQQDRKDVHQYGTYSISRAEISFQ